MSDFKVGDRVTMTWGRYGTEEGEVVHATGWSVDVARDDGYVFTLTTEQAEHGLATVPRGRPKHLATPKDQPIRLSANQLAEISTVLNAMSAHSDNDSFDTDNRHVAFGIIPVYGEDGEPVGSVVMDHDKGGWYFEVAR